MTVSLTHNPYNIPHAAPKFCKPVAPLPPQRPQEFCFLLLKGCQTRWVNEYDDALQYLDALRTTKTPFRAFRFDERCGHYIEWFGVDRSQKETPALD